MNPHCSRSRSTLFCLTLLALFPSGEARARATRVLLIPNGERLFDLGLIDNSCKICHVNFGGDVRNSFGLDVEALVGTNPSTQFWGPGLAALDSDRDGVTNGTELGDPLGLWVFGQPDPGDPNLLSLPGDPLSFPPPTPTPSPTPTPTPVFLDFTAGGGNAPGWLGGAMPGFGGTAELNAGGLCMTVPAEGDNFVLWMSPERFIELTDDTVYRVRLSVTTTQSNANAIPLLFVTYDNFSAAGGNSFGGEFWVLDVEGGANGIGRGNGRTQFEFYIAPNAVNTPQWKAGAFTAAADAVNDIRLQFRIIDANADLLTDLDSGTICVQDLEIAPLPRSSLALESTLYNPPIDSSTHFAETFAETTGGTATIDDGANEANYLLETSGDVRKTLGPFDPTRNDANSQLFPVLWEQDSLYRVRARIRADQAESDPVNAIFLVVDTATVELGMSQYTTRGGASDPMNLVASPRTIAAEYEAYFYSHNVTDSLTPNAARLRPFVFFMNSTSLGGDGNGGDPFTVEALELDKLTTP